MPKDNLITALLAKAGKKPKAKKEVELELEDVESPRPKHPKGLGKADLSELRGAPMRDVPKDPLKDVSGKERLEREKRARSPLLAKAKR